MAIQTFFKYNQKSVLVDNKFDLLLTLKGFSESSHKSIKYKNNLWMFKVSKFKAKEVYLLFLAYY